MIEIKHINVKYKDQTILKDSEIKIPEGKLTAISGKSGSGKTTLFYILGLISANKDYTYSFHGNEIHLENDQFKSDLRKSSIGFIFQEKNLHEYLSIKENIELYCQLANVPYTEEKMHQLLQKVNLKLDPSTITEVLSGGEKQRLAIACALAKDPDLIIADEPTSTLDDTNTDCIVALLKEIAHEGKMVIMATHNKRILKECDLVYTLENQKISLIDLPSQPKKQLHASKVSKTFSSWYGKFQFGESKRKKLLMTIIPAFAISLCVFSSLLETSLLQQFRSSLNLLGSNEVIVENKSTHIIDEAQREQMRQIKGVKEVLPLTIDLVDHVLVNDQSIDNKIFRIVPYFEQQKEQFQLDITYEGTTYLSYDAAKILGIDQATTLTINDTSYSVGGVLKEGNALTQVSNLVAQPTIYVPYTDLSNTTVDLAYIELDSFETFETITEDLQEINPDYQVTLSQRDYLTKIEQLKTYTSSFQMFTLTLTFLVIVLLCIAQLFTIYNQKYEISVLKANGLSIKEIIHLMLHMFFKNMVVSLIFSFLFLIIEMLIAFGFQLSVPVYSLKSISLTVGISALIYFIPSFLATLYIAHFDVEKLLRF